LLNRSVYFAISGKSTAGAILLFQAVFTFVQMHRWVRIPNSKVNVVEWLLSLPTVQVVFSSAFTIRSVLAQGFPTWGTFSYLKGTSIVQLQQIYLETYKRSIPL